MVRIRTDLVGGGVAGAVSRLMEEAPGMKLDGVHLGGKVADLGAGLGTRPGRLRGNRRLAGFSACHPLVMDP